MRAVLVGLLFSLISTLSLGQSTVFYSDRALGVNPLQQTPTFLSYAQVRVCSLPLNTTSPCAPVAVVTDQFGNSIGINGGNFGQLTTDAVGRFSFGCAPGLYQVQVAATGSNTPQLSYPVTCPSGTSGILSSPNVWSQNQTFPSIDNIVYVDGRTYSQVDVFAGANAALAVASAGSKPCLVEIPPGTYSAVSTLNGVSNCVLLAYGVSVSYTGTGIGLAIANVQNFDIKGLNLTGPGTGGSTIGLKLGIGSGGTGILTQANSAEDMAISGFNKCFVADGYLANGTYSNKLDNVDTFGCNINRYIVPTAANFANANSWLNSDSERAVTDSLVIDGANGWWFVNDRAENNGGFGANLPGTQPTNGNMWFGGWYESNVSGDFRSGAVGNIINNGVFGTQMFSANGVVGDWSNANTLLPAQGQYRNNFFLGLGPGSGGTGAGGFVVVNEENPPSGLVDLIACTRSGVDSGTCVIGTPEYPARVRGSLQITNLLISNTAPTIAGAGCGGSAASISTANGTASFDVNVGTAPTSGGCTVTMPAATTRWNCSVNDYTTISTGVFFQKQTASTTTSITLQNYSDVAVATAPTANDIYHVKCGGE